jgi:hypothetical protein
LGLNANYPVKETFLTHGHGDHDGGAQWMFDNLKARSWLGSADANNKTYNPKLINSSNLSPQKASVGGKEFTLLATPGHTPGSTSAVLTVKDNGKDVRVLINGGQSMTSSVPDVAQYLDSIERTYSLAKEMKVSGVMTPHIYWDETMLKVDEIIAKGRSNPGQFIFGEQTVLRQLAGARECSAAWLTRLDATRTLPIWRFNSLEWNGDPNLIKASVKLRNGWNQVAGQTIKFSVEGSNTSCTATTDGNGIATCETNFPGGNLVAEYAGAKSNQFVDLPANVQSTLPDSGGGCTIGSGRFDPLLMLMALAGLTGVLWRRRQQKRHS